MISIIQSSSLGVKKFVCDKAEELEKVDLRATRMGSKCFIIENSKEYILNGDGE